MLVSRLQEVLKDRLHRDRMSEAEYWDQRVKTRAGDARSVWHSRTFSDVWTKRQLSLLTHALDELLGGASGKDVLDVGCGTGRMTRLMAEQGARAVGLDFSEASIEAARVETSDRLNCRFEVGDIATGMGHFEPEQFDAVLSVGCLAVACTRASSLDGAFKEFARVVRPSGAIVVLEPIHTSALLGRVLKEPVRVWVDAAERAGLRLVQRRGMGFFPMRLALSSFDLPSWFVSPAFRMGEGVLDRFKAPFLADYTLLCFTR